MISEGPTSDVRECPPLGTSGRWLSPPAWPASLGFAGTTASAEPTLPLPAAARARHRHPDRHRARPAPGAAAAAAPASCIARRSAGLGGPRHRPPPPRPPRPAHRARHLGHHRRLLQGEERRAGAAEGRATSRRSTSCCRCRRGWSQVPDPNVPDAFAVIADRVGGDGLYTSNAAAGRSTSWSATSIRRRPSATASSTASSCPAWRATDGVARRLRRHAVGDHRGHLPAEQHDAEHLAPPRHRDRRAPTGTWCRSR